MPSDFRVPRTALKPKGRNKPFAIIQQVMAKVDQAELKAVNSKERAALLNKLTPGQVTVFAITRFEMEMNGGGFESFFGNAAGDYASVALAGLKAVGATKFARVLAKGMAAFPAAKPHRDSDRRWTQVEKILDRKPEAFEAADAKFFEAYDGEESLAKLLVEFIMEHSDDFVRS